MMYKAQTTMNDEQPDLPPATFGRRLMAKLVDLLIFNVAEIFVLLPYPFLSAAGMPGLTLYYALQGVCAILSVIYLGLLTCNGRQTPGYKLAGIRVMLNDPASSGTIGPRRSFGRAILDNLCVLAATYGIGLIDFLPIAFTKQKRALHDRVFGTRVVMVARPKYGAVAVSVIASVAFLYIAVFQVIKPFMLEAFNIPSPAMQPTLPKNSHFVVNRLYYRARLPQRGDIITFLAPKNAEEYMPDNQGVEFIKRVIGLPGDELRFADGKVYFYNGGHPQALSEPYILEPIEYDVTSPNTSEGAIWLRTRRSDLVSHQGHLWVRVPPAEYFILGDNRNDSMDSHMWGFLPRQNITGKVIVMFDPRCQEF